MKGGMNVTEKIVNLFMVMCAIMAGLAILSLIWHAIGFILSMLAALLHTNKLCIIMLCILGLFGYAHLTQK